jgi:aryl-alcohol dehydrogenase-like predicted oxidoreductase
MSSCAILGMAAFWAVDDPERADQAIAQALDAGVNHIDVAPMYGVAESQLGRTLPSFRDRVFLGCKSGVRDRDGALRELETSLAKLNVDRLDLWQLHAVCTQADLDAVLAPGGAVEALVEARQRGLTRWIGITGHLAEVPAVINRALQHVDLDTVMFPVNAALWGVPEYRREAEQVLQTCTQRDLGVMAIKAIAKGLWPESEERRYSTWYEPLDDVSAIQRAVDFTLSLPVHSIPTAGDVRLMPSVLDAVRGFRRLGAAEIEDAIRTTTTRPLVSATA